MSSILRNLIILIIFCLCICIGILVYYNTHKFKPKVDENQEISVENKTTDPNMPEPTDNLKRSKEGRHRNYHLFNNQNCGIAKSEKRILRGNKAILMEYPWIVALIFASNNSEKSWEVKCAGSLISGKHIQWWKIQ